MDEPDAHLHPSMTKQFLDVIHNVFVVRYNIRVIMATHSPSTVALAPEASLFIVNKTGKRVDKTSKDKALKILTAGVPSFSVNYENRRQVFVESQFDVWYYEKFYQRLSDSLSPEVSLSFISSGESRTNKNGIKVSNCEQVINITDTLKNAGNNFIWGIIDWDTKNKETAYIKVLGNGNRYSIESYILDPILVAALLVREKIVDREVLGLTQNENYIDFKRFDIQKLQGIIDFIVKKIASVVSHKNADIQTSRLINNLEINIPKWYLHYQGHELEELLLKAFPQLNGIKKGKEEALKLEILNKVVDDVPELVCIDIVDVLKSIQAL